MDSQLFSNTLLHLFTYLLRIFFDVSVCFHIFAHIVNIVLCPVFHLVYFVSKVVVNKSFAFLQKKTVTKSETYFKNFSLITISHL